MECTLCKQPLSIINHKIYNGVICHKCYKKYPSFIRENIDTFSDVKLITIQDFLLDRHVNSFTPTAKYGLLEIDSINGIIQINDNGTNYYINVLDLKSADIFCVCPRVDKYNHVKADVKIQFKTTHPNITISYVIKRNVECNTSKESAKELKWNNPTSNTNTSILDKNPNIKKQIESMYADIDKLFEERKSQADKRESVLDAYADKLKKREEELEQIAKDNEKEYIKKSMELEKEYKEKEDSLSKTYIQKEIELEELQNKYEQKSNELFAEKQSLSFEYKKLQTQKDTLKSEQDNLREREQLINEKKVNVLGVNDGEELNSIIEQLKAENEELKKQNEEAEELIDDANAKMEEVAQNSKKKDKVISKLKSRMELQSETIQEYEDKLIEMENAPKESSDSIDTSDFEDKIRDLENLLSEKDKENSTMRDNLNQEQTRYNQLNEMYLAEKKEKDELGKKLEESKNNSSTVEKKMEMSEEDLVKSRANTIKQELDKIGISTDIVPSNGDLIIAGEKDGCTICVNVNAEIIYAEKSVKKAVKYQKEVEEWTQQDIRASYAVLSSTNKFVCKYTYKDVSKAVMEILERFKTIS